MDSPQKKRPKYIDRTFAKFVLVGVINNICGLAIMFVLYNVFHLGYWLSSFSKSFLSCIISYFLNKNYTFNRRGRSIKTLILFIASNAISYLIAYGIAKPLVIWLLDNAPIVVQENIAMFVGVCFCGILNYLGQRLFVFKNK